MDVWRDRTGVQSHVSGLNPPPVQAVSFQQVRSDRLLRAGRAHGTRAGPQGSRLERLPPAGGAGDFQSRAESTAFQAVVVQRIARFLAQHFGGEADVLHGQRTCFALEAREA
jgi:hypothetical protein